MDDKDFEKLNVKNSSWLMACLGDDGDNILLILTAKEIKQEIKIAARANYEKIIPKLKHAGAIHIVCPKALGGTKLAQAVLSENISPALNHDNNLNINKNNKVEPKKELNNSEYGIGLN